MSERVTYMANREGSFVQVAVQPGSEAEQRRWRELGDDLHRKMDEAIAEAGLALPQHPEDDEHNIAVGRTVGMLLGAEVQKGSARWQVVNEAASFYSAWAKAHGYPGIAVISWADPLQLDIGEGVGGMVAELRGGQVTILSAGPEWVRPGWERVKPGSFGWPIVFHNRLIVPVKGREK